MGTGGTHISSGEAQWSNWPASSTIAHQVYHEKTDLYSFGTGGLWTAGALCSNKRVGTLSRELVSNSNPAQCGGTSLSCLALLVCPIEEE